MDRKIIYAGQIPLDADLLQMQVAMMTACSWMMQGILGTNTMVDGLSCIPTAPASLTVQVSPGQIFEIDSVDAADFGAVDADTTHQILKQGLSADTRSFTFVAPSTSGYAQNFLVQVGYSQVDDTPIILPYYNVDDPAVAFTGPNGSGDAQNTFRRGKCVISTKAGVAATSGTQTTPTPDPGYLGIYVVTVANGQTTITSGNIVVVASAPFIDPKLPAVPAGVQSGKWLYGVDIGTKNAMVIALNPVPPSLRPGMTVRVKKIGTANDAAMTLDIGLGANAVKRATGADIVSGDMPASTVAELTWDGSVWQYVNFLGFSATSTTINNYTLTIPYAVDSGAANNWVVSYSPAVVSIAAGDQLKLKVLHDVTGDTNVTVNSLSPVSVRRPDGSILREGDIKAGQEVVLQSDGSVLQVISALAADGARVTGDIYMVPYESPPLGTLKCNGALYARAGKYARLFGKIGTTYGVGDGTTTFAVPDYRSMFPRMWDDDAASDPDRNARTDAGGGVTGNHVGTKQAAAVKASDLGTVTLTPSTTLAHHTGSQLGGSTGDSIAAYDDVSSITATMTGGGNETRPKNFVIMPVIAF